MDFFFIIGAFVGGFYLGEKWRLPDLKSGLNLFLLRSLVIFAGLLVGSFFPAQRFIVYVFLVGYMIKGFNYGAGLKKRPTTEPEQVVSARPRPQPPIGTGKKKKRK